MEPSIDPSTGRPLPADAIQRIIHISPAVHVYNIPPLTSTKGYVAASWTADNNKRLIFTARLRVLETAIPAPNDDADESVKTDVLLEDPSNGQLFAAAPYTAPSVVEQVLDSSRFFAVRVEGEGGRKAVLGIGFEERSEAFDFSVALQEVRKTLGMNGDNSGKPGAKKAAKEKENTPEKKDFSLKEGETITVNIGGRGRRNPPKKEETGAFALQSSSFKNSFLPPPPSAQEVKTQKRLSRNFEIPPPGYMENLKNSSLPPPSSAQDVKTQRRLSRNIQPPAPTPMEDLGFDDGEFGEFQ